MIDSQHAQGNGPFEAVGCSWTRRIDRFRIRRNSEVVSTATARGLLPGGARLASRPRRMAMACQGVAPDAGTSLELVGLSALMERTAGRPSVKIGLIDGPVLTRNPDLVTENICELSGSITSACLRSSSIACVHGTFVAGILTGKRGSPAPAICPGCNLLVRPIFAETSGGTEPVPRATPGELAAAIVECIDAGARVVNLSLNVAPTSVRDEQLLGNALDQALRRGVLVVAAAGNQGTLRSSPITRHAWVLPVVACDRRGHPTNDSNLGGSIGRRGLGAPGEAITSLGAEGWALILSGTSVAAPFVTGAIALLWSEFPTATAAEIKLALTNAHGARRPTVVPPLLDAAAAYRILRAARVRR